MIKQLPDATGLNNTSALVRNCLNMIVVVDHLVILVLFLLAEVHPMAICVTQVLLFASGGTDVGEE